MQRARPHDGPVRVGILTVSDRAAAGEYEDRGGPAVESHLRARLAPGWAVERRVVADDRASVAAALAALADGGCALVVSTGGTGVAPRDVTPEATGDACDRMLPGFAEAMRAASLAETPMAVLSRAAAGVRGATLVINLPGSPRAVPTCLDAVLPAVPHALEQIGAPRLALAGAPRPARLASGGEDPHRSERERQ